MNNTIFSKIKRLIFKNKPQQEVTSENTGLTVENMPNPLIPWEIYGDIEPFSLRCLQGEEDDWVSFIWYPYWGNLSEEQKTLMKNSAPSQEWVEWLEFRDQIAKNSRESFTQDGRESDHNIFLEEFKNALEEFKNAYVRDRSNKGS